MNVVRDAAGYEQHQGREGTVAHATPVREPNGAFSHMRDHFLPAVSEAQTSGSNPGPPWPPTM
eukprot:CAMPEP_0181511334 /NCGR_PEP_ID=MMETSP1110-20121109/61372_1 /TAXON_ID=174948 /ORGANISM="Symbiodinium sp., Strain CCMP421" /LENGTH=62 /DNA_ID=CAMNT_0023641051 /DNA_START=393 /DNA_END=582 /DNA_ORIENTATION=-